MMNKTYRAGIVCFLCLMLCICGAYLLAASASADQTVIIISESADQQPVVIASNSTSASAEYIQPANWFEPSADTVVIQDTSSASSVIVMADNSEPLTQAASVESVTANTSIETIPAGLISDVHTLVNQARRENGLSALQYSADLQSAADIRAKESTVSFTHTRPDGSAAASAVDVDYTIAGENLIQVTTAYATGDIIVSAWMNSPSHRDNILNTAFTRAAIGIYEFNGTTYISQIFTD